MPNPRRTTTRYRAANEERSSNLASMLTWTAAILLLIAVAAVSWIGSFYIFGHPEEPFSYRVLQALKKIEAPKRFELTAAPRGEFLSPQALYERYGELGPRELKEVNRTLLRGYIRNYQQTKDLVPYVIGRYTILDSFELGPNDLFTSGVVAVAQANEDPRVILEHVFTTPPQNVEALHRMLLTGLDLSLQRRMDLSAVVHVDRLRDGRLKVTAMPLIYGSYASTQGPGTFSLEPPLDLNVQAGLPIVHGPRLESASEKFAAYRRRAGLAGAGEDSVARAEPAQQLLRVSRPEPLDGSTPQPEQEEDPAAAVALPPETEEQSMAAIPEGMRVLPALPVEPATAVAEETVTPALPEETPSPSPSPAASPSPTAAPAVIANVEGRKWDVYEPGRMPRGRLVPLGEMTDLASRGVAGERLYLQGDFVVTASGADRAVLRSQGAIRNPFGGGTANVRVIVDFPAGSQAPGEGTRMSRDSSRPFQITEITRTDDGQINVRAREITQP